MKKLLVFASGDAEGGGSGFQKLVEAVQSGVLQTEIVGVVSNHANGGVAKRAKQLGVEFFDWSEAEFSCHEYQFIFSMLKVDYVALSGWLKLVRGLPADKTINIHPGPLPRFGGPGMYGHHVHEAVMKAFRRGEVTHSEVCMHFVTDKYDRGPIFFRCKVEIMRNDTPESLAARVNKVEHAYQALFTNKVITGESRWDGNDPASLRGAVSWPEPREKLW